VGDGADLSDRDRVGGPAWPGPLLGWFEALSAAAVLITGAALTVVGWDELAGSGRAWGVVLLAVGGAAAAAVVPLSRSGNHGAAALAALVALVTPTGFAYPVNALMVVVAVVEAARAWRTRRQGQGGGAGRLRRVFWLILLAVLAWVGAFGPGRHLPPGGYAGRRTQGGEMARRPFLAGAVLAVVCVVVGVGVVSPAAAEQVFRRVDEGSAILDGFRGSQAIRTDPATVAGIGYIHPIQMDTGAPGGDFLAIGTANGWGVDNCADDYDAKWTIYTDGRSGGVYFCNDESLDAYSAGANPSFRISWGWCNSEHANRWQMVMGGLIWACYANTASAGITVGAGLETTGGSLTDRNIDVKYTDMQFSLTGSQTWINFGPSSTYFTAPSYTNQYVSATAFNVFLAPLD
jgi:hypothetical protein